MVRNCFDKLVKPQWIVLLIVCASSHWSYMLPVKIGAIVGGHALTVWYRQLCAVCWWGCKLHGVVHLCATGNLTPRHREVFLRNPLFVGMRIPEVREIQPLERKFTKVSPEALDFMKVRWTTYLSTHLMCSDVLCWMQLEWVAIARIRSVFVN